MNLADKLANVDMTEDNRISAEDRKYCEAHQKAYELAIDNLKNLVFFWECTEAEQDAILGDYDAYTRKYSSYISIEDFSIRKVEDNIMHTHEKFVRYLVNYFDRTYHIELDVDKIIKFLIPQKPEYDYSDRINYEKRVEEWEKEMEEVSLQFEDVLDQILIQLDGRTFVERAIDEIIVNCRQHAWLNGEPYFEVKGDTIRFQDYFCSHEYWISRDRWTFTSRMKSIIPALYHYETNCIGNYPHLFNRLFNDFSYPELDFDNDNKLMSIKCFKKGRVDVKFKSKTYATEFADKYLGWVANGGITE